jgi:hypothetical protein
MTVPTVVFRVTLAGVVAGAVSLFPAARASSAEPITIR